MAARANSRPRRPPARSPAPRQAAPGRPRRLLAVIAVAAFAMAGMTARPARAALDAGRPACDYCRMILGEPAFGAEARLRSGAVRIYDSIECMAAAVLTDSLRQRDILALSVVDHDAPHARLPIARATLVHCPRIESPMGLGLLAVRGPSRARALCPAPAGGVLDWKGVLGHVNRTWFAGRLAVDSHAGAGVRPARAGARAR